MRTTPHRRRSSPNCEPMSASKATYLDSSAIVKLVVNEEETPALQRYLKRRMTLVSSALARTEVHRAVLHYDCCASMTGSCVRLEPSPKPDFEPSMQFTLRQRPRSKTTSAPSSATTSECPKRRLFSDSPFWRPPERPGHASRRRAEPCHLFFHSGGRFSAKAVAPSMASSPASASAASTAPPLSASSSTRPCSKAFNGCNQRLLGRILRDARKSPAFQVRHASGDERLEVHAG